MHPTLFVLAGVPVRSYGVLAAVGFVVSLLLSVRAGRRQGIPVERMLDLAFWILISSLAGSRLLHVITEVGSYYRRCAGAGATRSAGRLIYDCTAALHLWEGGLVWYGGPLAAALAILWYCRRHRLGFAQVTDLLAPLLALGHFFGRLGCLSVGCCYGRPTASFFGLVFPPSSIAYQEMQKGGLLVAGATGTPPLHPTQLYEAVAELAIALLLIFLARRKRRHGDVMLAYVALYSVLRFGIELFRADPDRHYLVQFAMPAVNRWLRLPHETPSLLSTSQLISLLLLLGLAAFYTWRFIHDRSALTNRRA